jgi:Aerotolerance regulator N-terminal
VGLSFGNPLGFLALLGLPAVVAIHFLQRRARLLRVSTLFLLQQLHRESQGGPRFERLRASIPLWLQLLAVLLLTWLMVEPRWLAQNSVQQVVVVLDGSASMSVSRSRMERELPKALETLSRAAAITEFYLLDSRRDAGHLYHGNRAGELMEAARKWQPAGGAHDPAPSLRLARSLAGREGTVVFVTDHEHKDLPLGARLLAIGQPEENTGIAGVSVEEKDGRTIWRAVLRNYGTSPAVREWWAITGGSEGPRQQVTIPPGAVLNVQSAFAEGQTDITLHLTPDAFVMDDTAVVVKPRPRTLTALLPAKEMNLGTAQQVYPRLLSAMPGVTVTADRAAADLEIVHYNPLDPSLPSLPACLFVRDPRTDAALLTGQFIQEEHPYFKGLVWQGLLVQDSFTIPAAPGDEVLLWLGERPLIFLRGPARQRQLCFNFDLRQSNALKLPAFVLTVHRFLEDVRRGVVREEWRNLECSQRLDCPVAYGAGEVTLTIQPPGGSLRRETVKADAAPLLTAPDTPALIELHQGDRLLLRGGVAFADVREADFTAAASAQNLDGIQAALVRRHSREDTTWRAWLLALAATALASWYFIHRPAQRLASAE